LAQTIATDFTNTLTNLQRPLNTIQQMIARILHYYCGISHGIKSSSTNPAPINTPRLPNDGLHMSFAATSAGSSIPAGSVSLLSVYLRSKQAESLRL